MTTTEETGSAIDTSDEEQLAELRTKLQREVPEIITARTFFQSLDLGTFVCLTESPRTEHIFWGFESDDDGESLATLIHSRYMTKQVLSVSHMEAENPWKTVTLDSGDFAVAEVEPAVKLSTPELRHALRHVLAQRESLESQGHRVLELETSLTEVKQDFTLLNEHLNQYAVNESMCGQYERTIFGWNETFAQMKLAGRLRDYSVPVRVSALADGPLEVYPVPARSPEEAREIVQSWRPTKVVQRLAERDYTFTNIEVVHEGTPQS